MGSPVVVTDFLPTPDQLALRDEKVKVTISLSRTSLEFFKNQAARHHTAYQRMIRNLLDAYALQNASGSTGRSKPRMIAADSRKR